jgi:AcrR family transcriptional regulator
MARTRRAVLAGALRAVEQAGTRRMTMTDVAVSGGVAKATVYNHFRTKADVLTALVEAEVRTLGEECVARAGEAGGRDGLAEAVEHAAVRLSEHRALRSIAASEPDVLARLLLPGDDTAWPLAREVAGQVLRAAGRAPDPAGVDTVLRVVASHAAWPSGRGAAAATADALARGLPVPGAGAGDGGTGHGVPGPGDGEAPPAPPAPPDDPASGPPPTTGDDAGERTPDGLHGPDDGGGRADRRGPG